MLSQTSEYALRAVLHLAREREAASVTTAELSAVLGLPRNYLSKILHELARRGLLTSTRGPTGGFRLSDPAGQITLSQIVEVFEPLVLDEGSRCLLGKAACSDRDPCVAHHRWKEVAVALRRFFEETTVAELIASGGSIPSGGGDR